MHSTRSYLDCYPAAKNILRALLTLLIHGLSDNVEDAAERARADGNLKIGQRRGQRRGR